MSVKVLELTSSSNIITERLDAPIIHFEQDKLSEVTKIYGEMISWIAAEISKLLTKYEGRILKLSYKQQTELIMAIEELYCFWKSTIYTNQVAILKDIATCKVQPLVIMHHFIVKAYQGMLQ